jgi:hypothetical protein
MRRHLAASHHQCVISATVENLVVAKLPALKDGKFEGCIKGKAQQNRF